MLNVTVSDVSIESLILKSCNSIYFLIAVFLLALVLPFRLFIRSFTILCLCWFVLLSSPGPWKRSFYPEVQLIFENKDTRSYTARNSTGKW